MLLFLYFIKNIFNVLKFENSRIALNIYLFVEMIYKHHKDVFSKLQGYNK